MATLAKLDVTVSANTAKYMKGMKAMNGMNARAGKSLTRFAKIAAGVGAVGLAAFAAMTVKSVKAFVEFEKGLKEVTTLSKFTSAEIKHMSKETLKMGRQFGQTFKVLHKARYDIVSAGFASITEQTTILTQANKLAVAGVTDVSTATDLLTSALNAYNLEASDAEDVADLLFTTVKLGKTTIDELAASMGKVMPIAKGAGVSLVEVGAALATMTAAGIQTAPATTALTTMLGALAAPASAAGKAMLELGIKTTDAQGKMLPLLDVVKQFEGMDLETIKKLVPSEEAAKAILAIANNTEKFSESLLGLEKRTGAVDSGFKIMAGSARFQIDQLKMWWESFLVTMGEDTAIGDTLGSLLEMLEKNETELIAAAKALGIFVGWISTSSLSLITDWIKLLSDSGDGTSNLRVELDMLNDDINEKMIGTLDSLFNKLGTSWDGVLPYWQGAMATIKSFYSGWINGLVSLGKAGWTAIGNAFKTVWRIIKQTLQGNMAAAWNTVKTTAVGVAVAIRNAFVGAINRVIARVTALINKFNALKRVKNFLGFSGGGPVAGYAAGGNILGQGGIDNVPIMATAGEFMIRKSVAEKNYGVLTAINSGRPGMYQFMAEGGGVQSGLAETTGGITTSLTAPTGAVGASPAAMEAQLQSYEEALLLQEIYMESAESLWVQHYEALAAMETEAYALKTTIEGEREQTRLEKLQEKLQGTVDTEQEHADKIAELKLKTLEDMNAALKAGIIDYFAALGASANGMKALKGIMIGIAADTVAGLAQQWGIFYFLSGAAKVASSIWPPNAQGIAGGLKEMAAGSALMLLAGAAKGAAASASSGGGGGAADSPAADATPGDPGADDTGAGAEDTADGSGLVVNIHVEGHIVDEQKFLEEVVMPNMAKAVGRGAAYDGQYDMISERT